MVSGVKHEMQKGVAPALTHAAVDAKLREVDRRLQERYHTAPLGNQVEPMDELMFIQLSIRTREGAYTEVFSALKSLVGDDWARLLTLPDEPILAVLASGGMAQVKLGRLRWQIADVIEAFGEATLEPLRAASDEDAERFLTSLTGVGPKAARCVLMYSLGRQVFPVDSHCLRVISRLGFVPAGLDRKAAHDVVQALVPPIIRHTLHVNLVHHGRAICRAANPDCGSCSLLDLCPTGIDRGPGGT
jgi:endonuclease III